MSNFTGNMPREPVPAPMPEVERVWDEDDPDDPIHDEREWKGAPMFE